MVSTQYLPITGIRYILFKFLKFRSPSKMQKEPHAMLQGATRNQQNKRMSNHLNNFSAAGDQVSTRAWNIYSGQLKSPFLTQIIRTLENIPLAGKQNSE